MILLSALTVSVDLKAQVFECWLACHNPPDLNHVSKRLRSCSNPKLNWIARGTGIATTYLGKVWGIMGWRDYHTTARVSGRVTHAATSSDGLYTIDVEILRLFVGSKQIPLDSRRFIRIEVFPGARRLIQSDLIENQDVCVTGKFMWDGDGFFEIHPKSGDLIQTTPC